MIQAVLLNDTRVDMHHGCSIVISVIFKLAHAAGIRIIATAPAHLDWRKNPKVLHALNNANLVIVNGEGTIHHNRIAGEWLLSVSSYAKNLGIPTALINATWQENSSAYINMAQDFSLISVRETASQTELMASNIKSRVIPDLALFTTHTPQQAKRCGIIYTDSVVGIEALALYRQMKSLRAKPVTILYGRKNTHDFITSLRRFLPNYDVLDPRKTFAACHAAITDITSQIDNQDIFLEKISQSRLIVTGRFHVLILALATRTPFLVIASNTYKNLATLQDSGLGLWRHVKIDEINADLLEKASKWRDNEPEMLDKFLEKGRTDMKNLFSDLRKISQ